MSKSSLNIIQTSPIETVRKQQSPVSSLSARSKEIEARFERLWLTEPKHFHPDRNCMEKERIDRTWTLLRNFVDPAGKYVADIGSGSGTMAIRLKDAGARVLAIDTSENALKYIRAQDPAIETSQGTMPVIKIPDGMFDIVVCTDVIAELYANDHRLFFAELARLVKPGGHVLCSTPIDTETDGGTERFLNMAQTELTIISSTLSYHALHLRIKRLCKWPGKYIEGWLNSVVRANELRQLKGFKKQWYWVNTTFVFMWFWFALQAMTDPLLSFLKRSPTTLNAMEKSCRVMWGESGISHVIFIGQVRPLNREKPHERIVERPGKKQVWE
jgi:2-polyprenyl-3-methyl-5-hydroxy-6-metoxy-1,4-benzoquinol methylase